MEEGKEREKEAGRGEMDVEMSERRKKRGEEEDKAWKKTG